MCRLEWYRNFDGSFCNVFQRLQLLHGRRLSATRLEPLAKWHVSSPSLGNFHFARKKPDRERNCANSVLILPLGRRVKASCSLRGSLPRGIYPWVRCLGEGRHSGMVRSKNNNAKAWVGKYVVKRQHFWSRFSDGLDFQGCYS